jgi:peroxiredoxin
MAALPAGATAPQIELADMSGARFSLADELRRGPVLLAFFKVSCPICQYTFPFLERIYRGLHGKASVVGVSQNAKGDTEQFLREYGVTFRTLLDDRDRYPASNAYGLTNVPTMFLISPDDAVVQTVVGWSRAEVEKMSRRLAEMLKQPAAPVFRPGEQVEANKSG